MESPEHFNPGQIFPQCLLSGVGGVVGRGIQTEKNTRMCKIMFDLCYKGTALSALHMVSPESGLGVGNEPLGFHLTTSNSCVVKEKEVEKTLFRQLDDAWMCTATPCHRLSLLTSVIQTPIEFDGASSVLGSSLIVISQFDSVEQNDPLLPKIMENEGSVMVCEFEYTVSLFFSSCLFQVCVNESVCLLYDCAS